MAGRERPFVTMTDETSTSADLARRLSTGRVARRSGWLLALSLAGSLPIYGFIALMGGNGGPQETLNTWLVWIGIVAAAWIIFCHPPGEVVACWQGQVLAPAVWSARRLLCRRESDRYSDAADPSVAPMAVSQHEAGRRSSPRFAPSTRRHSCRWRPYRRGVRREEVRNPIPALTSAGPLDLAAPQSRTMMLRAAASCQVWRWSSQSGRKPSIRNGIQKRAHKP